MASNWLPVMPPHSDELLELDCDVDDLTGDMFKYVIPAAVLLANTSVMNISLSLELEGPRSSFTLGIPQILLLSYKIQKTISEIFMMKPTLVFVWIVILDFVVNLKLCSFSPVSATSLPTDVVT